MSKQVFSTQAIKMLKKNPNVKNVSENSITYSNQFKNKFINAYLTGIPARKIFEENGFDTNIISRERIENAAYRWKKAYEKDGLIGLTNTKKGRSGRPRKKTLTKEELIKQQEAKIKLLEGQVYLLKKLDMTERKLLSKEKNMKISDKFKLIETILNQNDFKRKTTYFCELLEVSRSGYYNYIQSADIRESKEKADVAVKKLVLKAFKRRGYKKGSRSIKMIFENEFKLNYSRKKIQRIMRKYNITCPFRKPNPYRQMAKATKEHHVVPNKLKRKFKQGIPGRVLLTDITYLPYGNNRMAYLSAIKDGSTNEILAYHVSDKITLDIATDTIYKLMNNKKIQLDKNAFIHSDQGVHYTSFRYQALLKGFGLDQSMSRRGNCWDNAPIESFFGHLKDEVYIKSCKTLKELKARIDHYMVYYNNYRYQWNLKKMTPMDYRDHLLIA